MDLLFADMIEHVRIFLPKKTTADGVIGCVMSNVL